MSHYTLQLILESWVKPHVETSKWEHFDFSGKSHDETDDQCLHYAVEAGARIGAIFKEPTVTPATPSTFLGSHSAIPSQYCASGRQWAVNMVRDGAPSKVGDSSHYIVRNLIVRKLSSSMHGVFQTRPIPQRWQAHGTNECNL